MSTVKRFFDRDRKAFWLYFLTATGVMWESHKWVVDWPTVASSVLAGMIALKASQHDPKARKDGGEV